MDERVTTGKNISRRTFLTGAGVVLASLAIPLASGPAAAFADELAAAASADGAAGSGATSPVVILHTNDVHCELSNAKTKLGYAALINYAKTQREKYGEANVKLVDAGDNVQGGFEGSFTKGEAPAQVIGACGYDLLIPGNHEFDYGQEQFFALRQTEGVPYVCCNYLDAGGTRVFDAYRVLEYPTAAGAVRVAFVGATTPSTLTSSSPNSFKDKDGNIIYSFCGDESGQKLYDAVQAAVDEARDEGKADYVVLVAHLGETGSISQWRSDAVVAHTTGIDVVVDGHSHEMYVQTVQNKAGEDVVIAQTGTKFQSFGRIEINPADGTATASLDATGIDGVSAELIKEWDGEDATIAELVAKLEGEMEQKKKSPVGTSEELLRCLSDDGLSWIARKQETNLGDLCADAVLYFASNRGLVCDLVAVNGGGIRANIAAGTVTYGDLVSVHPYMNQLCSLKVSGQHVLDMLEVGAMKQPEESGGFLQVSEGVSYTVRTDIPTPVVLKDDDSALEGFSGERRVKHARIDGKDIDPAAEYTVAGSLYVLVQGGNCMPIPANAADAVFLGVDVDALTEYIQVNLKGNIGEGYADEAGQGRIVVTDHETEPEPVPGPDGDGSGDGDGAGGTDSGKGKATGNFAAASSKTSSLASTGDPNGAAVAGATAVAGAAAVSAILASATVLAGVHEEAL